MKEMLKRLMSGQDLTESEASDLMGAMAGGQMDPALGGAMLAALRIKGETPGEVRGFARRMRSLARVPDLPQDGRPMVDIVGTGGDGSNSINLSTVAALLAAAAGCRVAKHGNRAVSSRSGSADVLEALGLALPLDEKQAGEAMSRTGFTFLFARHYHPAMKHIAPVRAGMGVRTVFNLLGPLTNPAQPPYAVVGAYSPQATRLMAEALSELPIERAFVVHGTPHWDEPTPMGPFLRFDVRPGVVVEEHIDPLEVYNIPRCEASALAGGDAEENAEAIRSICAGVEGPQKDAAVLGATLAVEVSGLADSALQARERVEEAISNGAAQAVLDGLRG